jgi:uncharacterized membrane protein
MNHGAMEGMFWGGLVMAIPPVVIGIVLAIYIFRQQRADRTAEEERAAAE